MNVPSNRSEQVAECTKGYWLIEPLEPPELDTMCSYPELDAVALTFLQWIAHEVSQWLDLPSRSIVLTAIYANYHGEYPCLALKGPPEQLTDELGAAVESAATDLAKQPEVLSFLRFLISSGPDCKHLSKERRGTGPVAGEVG